MSLWKKALFGAFGGLLPTVVVFYQRAQGAVVDLSRFKEIDYVVLTFIYLGIAAIVACIYPYKGVPTPWKSVLVGVALPTIVGSASGIGRRIIGSDPMNLELRGVFVEQTMSLMELLALF